MTYDEVRALTAELVRAVTPPARCSINVFDQTVTVLPVRERQPQVRFTYAEFADTAEVRRQWKEANA